MLFSRAKGVVGLDIGSSAVKLVELKERKPGDFHLQRVGFERLSPEAIVDGSIMDSSLVVDAIHKLNDQTAARNPLSAAREMVRDRAKVMADLDKTECDLDKSLRRSSKSKGLRRDPG